MIIIQYFVTIFKVFFFSPSIGCWSSKNTLPYSSWNFSHFQPSDHLKHLKDGPSRCIGPQRQRRFRTAPLLLGLYSHPSTRTSRCRWIQALWGCACFRRTIACRTVLEWPPSAWTWSPRSPHCRTMVVKQTLRRSTSSRHGPFPHTQCMGPALESRAQAHKGTTWQWGFKQRMVFRKTWSQAFKHMYVMYSFYIRLFICISDSYIWYHISIYIYMIFFLNINMSYDLTNTAWNMFYLSMHVLHIHQIAAAATISCLFHME